MFRTTFAVVVVLSVLTLASAQTAPQTIAKSGPFDSRAAKALAQGKQQPPAKGDADKPPAKPQKPVGRGQQPAPAPPADRMTADTFAGLEMRSIGPAVTSG
ncbi:MAG: hypothetical protein ACM3NQ_13630, partial [Bacteroidales bacterium]